MLSGRLNSEDSYNAYELHHVFGAFLLRSFGKLRTFFLPSMIHKCYRMKIDVKNNFGICKFLTNSMTLVHIRH